MTYKIYQVDAFTHYVFGGNPAAVCPLQEWLDDSTMQNIAMENNLAETAFYVKVNEFYEIRWFTPTTEVDLCGHATLAAAHVLFHYENHIGNKIQFFSPKSGELSVTQNGKVLTLNFPQDEIRSIELFDELTAGFNISPVKAFQGKTDYVLIYKNEDEIKKLVPSFDKIAKLGGRGIIVTAQGNDADFVSRFFAPQAGINEDPVTGSAHTTLTPYWANRLNKTKLSAIQLSKRIGYLNCKHIGNRVEISGEAKLYLKGSINLQ